MQLDTLLEIFDRGQDALSVLDSSPVCRKVCRFVHYVEDLGFFPVQLIDKLTVLWQNVRLRSGHGFWGQLAVLRSDLWGVLTVSIYQNISSLLISCMTLYCFFSQAAAALTQLQTSIVWFRGKKKKKKKLASYATPSSEWGIMILPLHTDSERNEKNDRTQRCKENKNTGGYAEVKAIAFIDCESLGQLTSEVERRQPCINSTERS